MVNATDVKTNSKDAPNAMNTANKIAFLFVGATLAILAKLLGNRDRNNFSLRPA